MIKLNNNLDEEITLVPFNPTWSQHYQLESRRLQQALGNEIIGIEHIGSTAIPNIYAKPIIDILIGIKDIRNPDTIIQKLNRLGYEYFGEANVPGRLYFRLRLKHGHQYNVALCEFENDIWNNNILFRDYLIKHPEEAKQYSLLKKAIFDSGVNLLLDYSSRKHNLITEILNKAINK